MENSVGLLTGKAPPIIGKIWFMFDRKEYSFTPQEDVTAFEVAKLVELFFITWNRYGPEMSQFVKDNNLERHFTLERE